MENPFDFGEALKLLKGGKSVSRKGWNGKGLFITLQVPDENSKMTRPYIYITTPVGSTNQFGQSNDHEQRVPWLASQTDLMSEDWFVVE